MYKRQASITAVAGHLNVSAGAVTPQLTVAGTAGGGSRGIEFVDNNDGKVNFFIGAQENVNNGFEISRADAGTTSYNDVIFQILTGGEATIANGLTLANGNLTVAVDHGIAFGNASGGTKTIVSNLLDDYEEGTFTPAVTVDSGSVGSITASGRYTKIGNSVTVTFSVQIGSASNALLNTFTGFPFTPSNITAAAVGAIRENGNTGDMWHIRATPNSTAFLVRLYDNSQGVVAGDTFLGSVTYLTNT